jgi:hypothetical protein
VVVCQLQIPTPPTTALVPQLTSDESDVLAHQLFVHADQRHGQRVCQELALELDGVPDDPLDGLWVRTFLEVCEE